MSLFDTIFEYMDLQDTAEMALNGEFLASLIDEFLDILIEKNDLKKPTDEEMEEIRSKVLTKMKEKYPNAGIILKKEEK